MAASPARRSRPAEPADGKSQFLPRINKVGTGRAALGAAREGKGVGSLLHGPLPGQLLPRELPPPAGAGRAAVRGGGGGPGGSVRRRDGAAGGKRAPRAVPGAGAARAGRRYGSGAEFLPGVPGPAARPPPAPLGSSRPRVHSHALTLSHTGTPVTHTLRVAHTASPRARRVTRTPRFPRTLAASVSRALPPPVGARRLSRTGHTPRSSHPQPRVPSRTHGLCHALTLTLPRHRTRPGFPTQAHARRLPRSTAPGPPRASSRRHSPPQTSTHGAARRPRLLPGHIATHTRPHTHTHTHAASAAHARGGGRAGGRPRVCACGKPEDLACGPLGSSPPPPPGQLRGPGPQQLVFVPTRRPHGGWGAEEGSATPAPRRPGLGAPRGQRRGLHLPPGIPAPGDIPRPAPPSLPRFMLPPPSPPPPRPGLMPRPPGGWPRRRQRRALGGCDVRRLPEPAGERPTAPEARAEVAADLLADLRAIWPPQPGGRPGLFITGGRTQSLPPPPPFPLHSASPGYFVPAVQTIFNLYPLP